MAEKCPRCGSPTQKKFTYCPYWSCNLEKEREMRDFGLLGKEDSNSLFNENVVPGLNMNAIFNSMNSIIKDLTKDLGEGKPFSKSISVKLSPGKKPEIRSHGFAKSQGSKKPRSTKPKDFSEAKLKKFLKLPKQEPETEVRRLSKRLIYELSLPGVKNKEDIVINKLEKGIEIRALSDKKAYVKSIPLNIQLLRVRFGGEKLFLEFNA
jgi:hypothetical protein